MRTGQMVAAAVAALAVSLAVGPASAIGQGRGAPYHGTEYDLGGVSSPIDGPMPAVDDLADSITAATADTLREVAREREMLPYSTQDGSLPSAPAVVTYPRPAGIAASDQYAVTVWQAGRHHDSVVYKADARRPGNRELDTSWTSFSFSGPVWVSVRKLLGEPTGCLVRPRSAGIRTTFTGDTCSFLLARPANVSVEFAPNTTNPVLHPMLVFANPLEADVPQADDPDVLYLGPGIHRLGNVQLRSNQTVYLAGGAWVEAAFKGAGVQNVVIKGRGVLSGRFMDTGNQAENRRQPGLIDINCLTPGDPPPTPCTATPDTRNVLIDGITLVDGPRFNVRALGEYITVRNIKIIGWWINTDGIVAGNKSVVEDNFVKVNEDSLKLFWGDSVVRRNVVWQLENGAPFMLSWNVQLDSRNFHVYDNDVVHVEQYQAPTQGVFDSRHGGKGHLQRYLFSDIRIEDASWRLFYLRIEENRWYDPALGFGNATDLIFRDITAPEQFELPSVIDGIDAGHGFSRIHLVNVRMGDTCLTDAPAGNLQLDPTSTDQIMIMKSPRCGHPDGEEE